jgi:hypothetical protein
MAKVRKTQVRPLDKEDPLHELPKKNRQLSNIFNSSNLQQQLSKGRYLNKAQPPNSHISLDKQEKSVTQGAAGRPLFGAPSPMGYEGAVGGGRQRMFYSSQVF